MPPASSCSWPSCVCLPSSSSGPTSPPRPTRKAGPPPAFSPPSPSTRWPSAVAEARLPVGKTLDTFDFDAVPVISKAQVMALAAGDSWLEKGANLIAFGPPGAGKSHLAAALGLALVENGWRVLFTRTTDLVQKL